MRKTTGDVYPVAKSTRWEAGSNKLCMAERVGFEVAFAEALMLLLRGPAPSYAPHAEDQH